MKLTIVVLSLIALACAPALAWSQDTSWIEQNAASPFPLRVVQALDENVAWAAGEGGQVIRTTDGGDTWSSRPTPAGQHWALFALDAETCLVSGGPGVIWRTSDGGASWTPVHDAGTFIDGIHFFDALHGWAVGDPTGGTWVLLETNDGGMTWQPAPNAPASSGGGGLAHSFAWQGTQLGMFGTTHQSIWRTADGGASWTEIATNVQQVAALALGGGSVGLAAGDLQSLDRTTDAGQTWNPVPPPTPARLIALDWIEGSDDVWATTGQYDAFQSTDGGGTWTDHHFADPFDFAASDIDFGSANAGWVVGCVPPNGPGRIWHYTRGATGIAEPGAAPALLRVASHPNPFRSGVTFDIAGIAGEGAATVLAIEIFDATGRQIVQLEPAAAAAAAVRWDGRDRAGRPVAGGIYYYRVTSRGGGEASGSIVRLR